MRKTRWNVNVISESGKDYERRSSVTRWSHPDTVRRQVTGPTEVVAQFKTKPPVIKAAEAYGKPCHFVEDDGWYYAIAKKPLYKYGDNE